MLLLGCMPTCSAWEAASRYRCCTSWGELCKNAWTSRDVVWEADMWVQGTMY